MRVELITSGLLLMCCVAGCGDDGASVDATCGPWCTVAEECTTTSFDQCQSACVEELSEAQAVSSECADAVRDQNTCLGALTCSELEAWRTEVPPVGYPCNAEDDAVDVVCI